MNKGILILVAYLHMVQTTSKPETTSIKANITSATMAMNDKRFTNLEPTTTDMTTLITKICESNTTICLDDNNVTSVESNDLTVPITTTPKTPKNSSNFISKKSTKSSLKINSNPKDLCVCNLHLDYCDINCCCDGDCSYENKLVFDHCEPEFRYYDTRFCNYMEYIYINNTGHEWEVNQNGLFCVVRSNLPPTYTIQRKHPLKNFAEAEFQKRHKFSWPKATIVDAYDEILTTEEYKSGSKLWFIRSNGSLDNFFAYKNFITNHCTIKEDLKFLVNMDQCCTVGDIDENNEVLHAEHYFRNISVISNPSSFNISMIQKGGCPKNVCMPIESRICDDNYENCETLHENSTALRVSCHWSLRNSYSCINLVEKYKYIFQHNGTQGIQNIKLFLVLSNLTFDTRDGDFKMLQHAKIQFLWSNHTINCSSHLSGNPGYLSGKPILIANLITELTPINSTKTSLPNNKNMNYTVQLKLFRNALRFSSNFMTFPVNIHGKCKHDRNNYSPLEFGYNLLTTCEYEDSLLLKNENSSRKICQEIQMMIFKFLNLNATNNTLNNIYIGRFGNANVERIEEWSPLLFDKDLNDILGNISGSWSKDNQSIECGNITSTVAVDLFSARIDFDKLMNQEKILGTVIEFDDFSNFSLAYDSKSRECRFAIKITNKVMFHDMTTKKIRKLVDPPTFRIRLPHDFFYPFVKINNKALILKPLCHSLIVFCVFVIAVIG